MTALQGFINIHVLYNQPNVARSLHVAWGTHVSCVVPDGEHQSVSSVGDVAAVLGEALPAPLDKRFLSSLRRGTRSRASHLTYTCTHMKIYMYMYLPLSLYGLSSRNQGKASGSCNNAPKMCTWVLALYPVSTANFFYMSGKKLLFFQHAKKGGSFFPDIQKKLAVETGNEASWVWL